MSGKIGFKLKLMKSNSLEKLRLQIDELDQKIQLLISERADLAAEVAKVKQESNTQTAFYRPEREAEVLSRVIQEIRACLKTKILLSSLEKLCLHAWH